MSKKKKAKRKAKKPKLKIIGYRQVIFLEPIRRSKKGK